MIYGTPTMVTNGLDIYLFHYLVMVYGMVYKKKHDDDDDFVRSSSEINQSKRKNKPQ